MIRKALTVSVLQYICPGRKKNAELLYLSRSTMLNSSKGCPDKFTAGEQQGQLNVYHTCNIHNYVMNLTERQKKPQPPKALTLKALNLGFPILQSQSKFTFSIFCI